MIFWQFYLILTEISIYLQTGKKVKYDYLTKYFLVVAKFNLSNPGTLN